MSKGNRPDPQNQSDTTATMAAFVASLEAARLEGERDGFIAADDVHREMTAMLDEIARIRR